MPFLHEIRLPPAHAALAELSVRQFVQGATRVAIPRPEVQVIARLGGLARDGADVHILGPRASVHRKFIRAGQRVLIARLRLGASSWVLGVPAAELVGRPVPLEEVWGAAVLRMCEQMASARAAPDAARVLHQAILERSAMRESHAGRNGLAVEAARRLPNARVRDVAAGLGVSERYLRQVFKHELGLSPKAFTRVLRFRRAVRAAREQRQDDWAGIAADTGYYDQAHLINEFRAMSGRSPRIFMKELLEAELD